jgi:hypothetical protein
VHVSRVFGRGLCGTRVKATAYIRLRGITNLKRPATRARPHGMPLDVATLHATARDVRCFGDGLFARASHQPHAMQDHCELARHGDDRPSVTSSLGKAHAPGLQRGPLGVASQQRVSCNIQRRANIGITGPRDVSGVVELAGLEAPRCQAEVRRHRARGLEAARVIDGGLERQCRDRTDTRCGHQAAAAHSRDRRTSSRSPCGWPAVRAPGGCAGS